MAAPDGYSAIGLAEFTAEFDVELSFKEGEALTVLAVEAPEGWLMARNASGKEGLVPESYMGQGGGEGDGDDPFGDDGAGDVGLATGGAASSSTGAAGSWQTSPQRRRARCPCRPGRW